MKKICLMIFVGVFLNSCTDDPQPNIKELALRDFEENAFILDLAFSKTHQAMLGQGDLQALASTFLANDGFINYMNDVVSNVVFEVIQTQDKWKNKPELLAVVANNDWRQPTIQNYLKQIPVGILESPVSAALDLYSEGIDYRLNLLDDEDEILLVANYEDANGNRVSTDQFSLNFSQIKSARTGRPVGSASGTFTLSFNGIQRAKVGLGHLILNTSNEDLDEAIKGFVEVNPEFEILAGMLMPALQQVRASSGVNNSYKKFTDLIFGTQIPPERGEWDRLARYSALLATLDLISSENFNNSDQHFASALILATVHHTVTVLAWAKISGIE